MKNRPFISGILLACLPFSMTAQTPDYEVKYILETFMEYRVAEENVAQLLPQDTIKLIPVALREDVHEQYFADGTSKITVELTRPIQPLEQWLSPLDKLVVRENQFDIYSSGNHTYTETFPVDVSTQVSPHEFAPYHLATNNWQLPLSDIEMDQYVSLGYQIVRNDEFVLEIHCDSMTLIYNKNNWSETLEKLDDLGNAYFRQVVSYAPDDAGYLLYSDIITWSLDQRTHPCIEKVVYQRYSGIDRKFHNPDCAPTIENGFTHAKIEEVNDLYYTVAQIEGTNSIYLDITQLATDVVVLSVKDFYGITVVDHVSLHRDWPYVDLGEMPTGVYSVHLDVPNTTARKFIFKP